MIIEVLTNNNCSYILILFIQRGIEKKGYDLNQPTSVISK